jgi:hypothetical protein
MLTLLGRPRRFCDGVTRRQSQVAGGLSLLGGFFNLKGGGPLRTS